MSKHLLSPRKQRSGTRNAKRVIYIKAEGKNKTERNYFMDINKDKESKIVFKFAKGNETDPPGMMRQLAAQVRKDEATRTIDAAYCLADSDLDARKDKQLKQADKIAAKSECSTKIELLVSSPCFEIWYLCHFTKPEHQYMKNQDVLDELRVDIPAYKKSDTNLYHNKLKDLLPKVIETARAITEKIEPAKHHTVEAQPSTEVYRIFETSVPSCQEREFDA